MTRPIYEPNDQREVSRQGYGARQLARRPAGAAAGGGESPIVWQLITRDADISMSSGTNHHAFPDDGNNGTTFSTNHVGQIDIEVRDIGGSDFFVGTINEPGIVTCRAMFSPSGTGASLEAWRPNILAAIMEDRVSQQDWEYNELIDSFNVLVSIVQTYIVTQADIDAALAVSPDANYWSPRLRQDAGSRTLAESRFWMWWIPLEEEGS